MAASRSVRNYRWRDGSFGLKQADAPIFGKVLERIKKHGGWTAKTVVAEAQGKASEIHHMFEWDDKVAGNLHREKQARDYIGHLSVELVSASGSRTIPVAVSLKTRATNEGYLPTEDVMSDEKLRARLVAQALEEAGIWRRRYKYLNELAVIFAAIDKAVERQSKNQPREAATV
jgi:hypothetical protein